MIMTGTVPPGGSDEPSSALLMISDCSSVEFIFLNVHVHFVTSYHFVCDRPMRFPSPMKIGPASARILAFGWITVRGPIVTWDEQHISIMIHEPESLLYLWTIKINWKLATSPFNSHSLQTTAPAAMVTFALALIWKITLSYHSWWPTHNS